jgi:acetyl-CoA carboxylase biotin carboxyl carrier protein
MDRDKLEELIRLVEDSEIQELEIIGQFRSVRISKGVAARAERPTFRYEHVQAAPVAQAAPEAPAAEPAPAPEDKDTGLVPIASPMVGTFYAAPSPESPPYVRQGDRVNKGQVVCIVEAMKLMNEIESDVSGTVVRVMVENAQPVEYGQELFLIQPD